MMPKIPNLSGQQIDQYRLLRPLGAGGFAALYLAEHIVNKTLVAVKILFAYLNTENIPEFLAEAKVVLLDHPYITRIRNFGVDSGYPFFIMNYLEKGSLRQRHPKGTRLSWEMIVPYVKQMAEALQYVHDEGIVHRDVKPDNMLIADNGDIQLSDFGIAVISYTINQQKQLAYGTLVYIAPEHFEGKAERASDQYSLGATIYEWLLGVPPVEGSRDEIIEKLQDEHYRPIPLRRRDPSISPEIEALVMKMLAKNPKDRFDSMREFLVVLEQIGTTPPPTKQKPFVGHTGAVQTISWSPDGRYIASAGHDTTVQIWKAMTGQILYTYYGHTGEIWSIMWSPDGKTLVSAGDDEIVQVWEASSGNTLTSYAEHQGKICVVAWSPSGTEIASAGDDDLVQIWDFKAARLRRTYAAHNKGILALAWSPNGKYLASGDNDGVVRVWEAATGAYIHIYRGHADRVTALAWSPDGGHIASTSDDGTLQVWEARTGSQLFVCSDHDQTVSSVAWSPNGKYLASGSWDKTMRVWDTMQGQCLYTYRGHTMWVNAVIWSPDSKYIASASWDKTVHLIPIKSVPGCK